LESIGVSNADAAVAKIAGVDSLDKIGWPETDNLITAHDFLNVDRKAFLQKYGLERVSKQSVEVHGETKKTPNDIDAFAGESTYKVGKKIGKSTKLLTDPALIYRQSVCQIQNQAQLFRWHGQESSNFVQPVQLKTNLPKKDSFLVWSSLNLGRYAI
jgi:hypothetical protein